MKQQQYKLQIMKYVRFHLAQFHSVHSDANIMLNPNSYPIQYKKKNQAKRRLKVCAYVFVCCIRSIHISIRRRPSLVKRYLYLNFLFILFLHSIRSICIIHSIISLRLLLVISFNKIFYEFII